LDLVDWLLANEHCAAREEAVPIGQALVDAKMIGSEPDYVIVFTGIRCCGMDG
jgi:hypothetical protein